VDLSAFQLLTFDEERGTRNKLSVFGSSLGPHPSRRWRDLKAGGVPRDRGTFRLPRERKGASVGTWKKEEPSHHCFLCSGAHVLPGSQLTK
jgi:hypothetical protein